MTSRAGRVPETHDEEDAPGRVAIVTDRTEWTRRAVRRSLALGGVKPRSADRFGAETVETAPNALVPGARTRGAGRFHPALDLFLEHRLRNPLHELRHLPVPAEKLLDLLPKSPHPRPLRRHIPAPGTMSESEKGP